MPYAILERHNPQLAKPYFRALGDVTKATIKKYEKALYGSNYVHVFATIEEYQVALDKLRVFNLV